MCCMYSDDSFPRTIIFCVGDSRKDASPTTTTVTSSILGSTFNYLIYPHNRLLIFPPAIMQEHRSVTLYLEWLSGFVWFNSDQIECKQVQ